MNYVHFTQIRPAVPELNHADKRADIASPVCVHFMHIVCSGRKIT
jgi:hypothetical protein